MPIPWTDKCFIHSSNWSTESDWILTDLRQHGKLLVLTSNLENLLTEIVLWADLELEDKPAAYIRIGDFGLRWLLYYAKLEGDLGQRRELASSTYKGVHPNLIGGEFTWDIGSAIRFWT